MKKEEEASQDHNNNEKIFQFITDLSFKIIKRTDRSG